MDDEQHLGPLHVPQQSRRHKLRYILPQNDDVFIPPHPHPHHHHFLSPHTSSSSSSPNNTHDHSHTHAHDPHAHTHAHDPHAHHHPLMASTNLSLSTSPHARAYMPAPVGPFTGYASILGRSRFLRPAQELLEEVSRISGVNNNSNLDHNTSSSSSSNKQVGIRRVLEDSRSFFDDGEDDDVSLRCCNPNLVSMLHEVYKRYKVYCQQMQSAVSSFESVAGLGNAAPFLCFAVRAMFRHFQCLKNAILDQIRVTNNDFSSVDARRDRNSGSCSDDKGPTASNFLQPPVWRSQRGFPDKAVSVLRNWLFEHFLHPYPSDSDKQMLAHKTGLSRSQVSNWFTNARVRLWKPMVEEMHALERKSQCSKAVDTQNFITVSSHHQTSLHPQLTEKDFQIAYPHTDHDTNIQSKRSRIDAFNRADHGKEQVGMLCNRLPSNQVLDVGGGSQIGVHINHSSTLGSNQDNTHGLSWQSHGQMVPFWLTKQ